MSSNSINKNQQKIITDFKKFKNGATRTSMAKNAEKSIFDKLDKNLDGKVMGKRAIINANNVVMYETAHGWKKLN